uniref:Uncharacterized protein n=1 Tax=Brassica oleracea TaxID=3712 RepID=A0A3P6GCF7_BRAOL|nr:unnamed protein product [Brassica oleracea]
MRMMTLKGSKSIIPTPHTVFFDDMVARILNQMLIGLQLLFIGEKLVLRSVSRTENQYAINAAIWLEYLLTLKRQELEFERFTTSDSIQFTYIDSNGDWHRCNTRADLRNRVQLAVARRLYLRKQKISSGGLCEFIDVLPMFGPPRHDSAYTIRRASDLGVNIQMITDSTYARYGIKHKVDGFAARANIGIAPVTDATYAARGASDIIYSVSVTIFSYSLSSCSLL